MNVFGGYKVQGRAEDAARVRADAEAVTRAGAFSVVLEKVPERLARDITAEIIIPTIGIGASAACDGQVLVIDDMLGQFTEFHPKFVKRYAELGISMSQAVKAYASVGEMTRELVESWCGSSANELPSRSSAHMQSAADMRSDLEARLAALGEVADGVYARWSQGLLR